MQVVTVLLSLGHACTHCIISKLTCHVYFKMTIIYVFKCQNCDADLVMVMLNTDLHSRVKKGKRLLAGAIDIDNAQSTTKVISG